MKLTKHTMRDLANLIRLSLKLKGIQNKTEWCQDNESGYLFCYALYVTVAKTQHDKAHQIITTMLNLNWDSDCGFEEYKIKFQDMVNLNTLDSSVCFDITLPQC